MSLREDMARLEELYTEWRALGYDRGSQGDDHFKAVAQHSYQTTMLNLKIYQALDNDDEEEEEEEEEEDGWDEQEEVQEEKEEKPDKDDFYRECYGISHRLEINLTLSGGGPSSGITLYASKGRWWEVDEGYYWYQDWFKEKERFWLSNEELDLVTNLYSVDGYLEGVE